LIANGTSRTTIYVYLRDARGNPVAAGGETLELATTGGTLSDLTPTGNETYSAILTASTTAGPVAVSAKVGAVALAGTANVVFAAGPASASASSIVGVSGSSSGRRDEPNDDNGDAEGRVRQPGNERRTRRELRNDERNARRLHRRRGRNVYRDARRSGDRGNGRRYGHAGRRAVGGRGRRPFRLRPTPTCGRSIWTGFRSKASIGPKRLCGRSPQRKGRTSRVTASVYDAGASAVVLGAGPLAVGPNAVSIVVTAEDGATRRRIR